MSDLIRRENLKFSYCKTIKFIYKSHLMFCKFQRIIIFLSGVFLLIASVINVEAQSCTKKDSLIELLNSSKSDNSRFRIIFELLNNSSVSISTKEKLSYAKKALFLSERMSSTRDIANSNLFLGVTYISIGKYENAISYFIESAKLFSKIDESGGVATAYMNIGDSYAKLNDYNNSVLYFNRAIKMFNSINYSGYNFAVTLLNLGEFYRKYDEIDSALFYYKKSEILLKENDFNRATNAICSGNIGLIYGKQGKFKDAERRILNAIESLKIFDGWDAIAEYQTLLADVYVKQGRLKDAMNVAMRAYSLATKEGIAERVRDSSLKLSELYKSTKQFEQAYVYQSQYLIYRDSINNEEVIRKIADLRTEYEVGQKQAEVELEQAKVKILEHDAYYDELKFWGLFAVVLFVLAIFAVGLKLYRSRMVALRLADARFDIINDQREELDGMNTLKDQFFSVISHDLRGPMGNLVGVTDLIQMHLDDESYEEISDVNQMLRHSSQEVSELLENLLNWSMSEQGTMVYAPIEVSTEEICNPALRVLQLTANQKEITLTQELRSEVMLNADVSTVSTAIRNLLSNALKFTKENGHVELTVKQEGDFGVISIKDNGIGIPENKMDTLFSFTGGRKRWGTKGEKGVGLGLNLVKSFIELNHGRIEVTSTEGIGSVFSVYLPLYKEG